MIFFFLSEPHLQVGWMRISCHGMVLKSLVFVMASEATMHSRLELAGIMYWHPSAVLSALQVGSANAM
jgi:hypothetical protein